MRASRLLAELVFLQSRGRTTAAALAIELEVSERTIYRDVRELQAAGVPVWTETGPGGGIELLDTWTSRLEALTGDEAGALLLAGPPAAIDELGLGAVSAAAQSKLMSGLPPELRARAGRVRERFHLDAPGWFHHSEEVPHLPVLASAVWETRRVDVRYSRRDQVVSRRLDPLGLVLKAGTWYLVARHRTSVRTYRVSRMVDAVSRADRFDRPAEFSLESWWTRSRADFDRSMLRGRVRVRVAPFAVGRLPHVVDEQAAVDALTKAGPADALGWRTLDLAVESEEVALDQLVALGTGVEVLEPVSLRSRMRQAAETMAARHV